MTYGIFLHTRKEKMQTRRVLLIAMLAILVIAAAFVGNRVWTSLNLKSTPSNYSEITEYNGQKLSSINDFRENSIKGPQTINITNYRLTITGLVQNETAYTYDDVMNSHTHYQKVVTLHCVEGWEVRILWEGVHVKDLLQEAGYNQSAHVLIFYAQDGYATSLPLSYIINNDIMIAHKMNAVTIPPERGFPFQLVAEDKYGYKWAKWITRIEVSNDTNFRGYWEGYGYDNDADLR
jgi:DMSO/TMAO reductase YedYZ molybdopterin-dependent catalytic subunit